MRKAYPLFRSVWLGVFAVVMSQISTAHGQLIGNQSIGSPALSLTQQRAPTAAPNAIGGIPGASGAIGSISNRLQVNNTRFVRGARSRADFVGSNRTEQTGFVGAGQAIGVGRVASATDNLRLETTKAKINRPLPPQPAKGMYYPRLEVDLTDEGMESESVQELPASPDALDRIVQFSKGTANVSMAGGTAILRGTVNSKRTAELLMQIMSFEPGVDRVKSELEIR